MSVEESPERPEWHALAACVGHPVELFFPSDRDLAGPAIAVCSGCPVIELCDAETNSLPRAQQQGVRAGRWLGSETSWRAAKRKAASAG